MCNVRAVKSKFEVDAMQTAIDITEKAFRRLLQFIKPGVMEYEIEAELVHEFLETGQEGKLMGTLLPAATGQERCIMFSIMKHVKMASWC